MAYSTDNPPLLTGDQPIAGPQNWFYTSTHLATTVAASAHFTNGKDLGMRIGDMVTNFQTDTSGINSASQVILVTSHMVTRVAATSMNMSTGVKLGGST